MSAFNALVKFVAREDHETYFAALDCAKGQLPVAPAVGSRLKAYRSIDNLKADIGASTLTVQQLLAPVPSTAIPIYCVGLNYRSHAKEAKLSVPKYPPLWTKPATSLADPGEDIPVNKFCALSLPDYEGELVFVTSKDAKDVSVRDAEYYILGYTIGNDLSCRFFQLQSNSGGQFFYAKAFDKFAPLGPVLVSPEHYKSSSTNGHLKTRVNGATVQDVEIVKDMIFSPAQVLSHMSQGTTVPAGTAVMTGTAAGVGAFRSPKSFLNDGDVVEVEVSGVGTLRNVIRFENLAWWHRIYLGIQNVVLRIAT